jgi:hypothetical protein
MDSIPDILADADKDPTSILKHKNNNYLRNLLSVAYIPSKKMILPEGDPPYKTTETSDQITKGAFWQICRKMDVFLRSDVKSIFRESQFISALESVSEKEAQILLKAKDQNLMVIYPNLTYEKLKEVGYF